MTKKSQDIEPEYAQKRASYERLVATLPQVECKGAANRYTAVNGNMFSYLHPSGAMALRLPEPERSAFLKKYQSSLFTAYGVVQKEYVTVPDELLGNTKQLQKLFHRSYEYACELKPKAPARKKK